MEKTFEIKVDKMKVSEADFGFHFFTLKASDGISESEFAYRIKLFDSTPKVAYVPEEQVPSNFTFERTTGSKQHPGEPAMDFEDINDKSGINIESAFNPMLINCTPVSGVVAQAHQQVAGGFITPNCKINHGQIGGHSERSSLQPL